MSAAGDLYVAHFDFAENADHGRIAGRPQPAKAKWSKSKVDVKTSQGSISQKLVLSPAVLQVVLNTDGEAQGTVKWLRCSPRCTAGHRNHHRSRPRDHRSLRFA